MSLYFGAQHTQTIEAIKGAAYGAEAGVFWGFEHHDLERGLELRVGGEFDYTLPTAPVTLLIGGQIWFRVFESEYKDKDLRDDWSQQYKIWLGADFAVNKQISIKGKVIARSQDLKTKNFADERNGQRIDMEGDATGFTVDVEFKF